MKHGVGALGESGEIYSLCSLRNEMKHMFYLILGMLLHYWGCTFSKIVMQSALFGNNVIFILGQPIHRNLTTHNPYLVSSYYFTFVNKQIFM